MQASGKLRDLSAGVERGFETNGQGMYTFANLPYGRYRIQSGVFEEQEDNLGRWFRCRRRLRASHRGSMEMLPKLVAALARSSGMCSLNHVPSFPHIFGENLD